jgi:hypothetical protein
VVGGHPKPPVQFFLLPTGAGEAKLLTHESYVYPLVSRRQATAVLRR